MKERVYLSGYTKKMNKGIHCIEIDRGKENEVELLWTLNEENPSYIAVSSDGNSIIAVSSRGNGGIVYYERYGSNFIEVDSYLDMGKAPCHILFDESRDLVFVSNYHKGSLYIFKLEKCYDTTRLILKENIVYSGSSVKSPEQDSSKCHMAIMDSDRTHLFVVDLGADSLYVYSIEDEDDGILSPVMDYKTKLGMGPRHLEFSRDGKFIYLLGELDSCIEVLSLENGINELFAIDRIKTVPDGYEGQNSAAAIKRSCDGKFLYVSNRGHDSISIFRIKEDGLLEMVDNYLTSGRTPRDFSITDDGKCIIIGFQDSEFISILEMNVENGKVCMDSEIKFELSEIVCVI